MISKLLNNKFSALSKPLLVLLLFGASSVLTAQTNKYVQLSNEIQLNRVINEKWAGEIWIGSVFSNTPTERRPLSTNIQRYIYSWWNYYYSPKWKLSGSLAYFYNKDVPDIGQYPTPEYRLTVQGLYYINKTGFTLSTRMRGEFRVMKNESGDYEDRYRYRQSIKYVQPLNSKFLRQGVVYLLTSEELFFKSNGSLFDRNRFELGGGYLFTDNLQLELNYSNEYLPRPNANELYHAVVLTLTVNNFFSRLKSKLKPTTPETP